MQRFFDFISDAAIKFRIVMREDTGKLDLQAVYANKQTELITDISNELLINNYITDVIPKLNDSIFDWTKILTEAAMTNESKIIEQYFVAFEKYLRLNIFGYNDGSFNVIVTDITEKKEFRRRILEKNRQIEHLETELKATANVDMLTKLYSFQFITDSVIDSIQGYKEEGTSFCILLVDVDNFKDINQAYGLKAGDKVLQNIGQILGTVARKIDIAGRYGNDKFIILLNNLQLDIAKIIAEKIKEEIRKHSVKFHDFEISVSGALVEYNGESVETLLTEIETKMEKAKTLGRGTIIS